MVVVGAVVLLAGLVAGGYLLLPDRARTPRVGIAHIAPEKLGPRGRPGLKELHRALVAFTERQVSAERQAGIARRLEMAGSRMRASEWLVMTGLVALGAAVAGTLFAHVVIGLVAALFAVAIRFVLLNRGVEKRQRLFSEQLGETLQLLSGSLRAGLSLPQALQVVASEAPSPSGDEYRRVLAENRLGRDLTDALNAMAQRTGSEDFEWVVGAIDINRQTGGDLAAILDRVTDTIRARERIRGQVKALTAEGRMSGVVMACLPPGVLLFVWLTNPGYLDGFTRSGPLGWSLLVLAGLLLAAGIVVLKRMTKLEY